MKAEIYSLYTARQVQTMLSLLQILYSALLQDRIVIKTETAGGVLLHPPAVLTHSFLLYDIA